MEIMTTSTQPTEIATANKNLFIGFANEFFTLWTVTSEETFGQSAVTGRVYSTGTKVNYFFHQNLAKDESQAIAKAKSMGCVNLTPDPELRGKSGSWSTTNKIEIEPEFFRFGKYCGEPIADCVDFKYLSWYLGECRTDQRELVGSTIGSNLDGFEWKKGELVDVEIEKEIRARRRKFNKIRKAGFVEFFNENNKLNVIRWVLLRRYEFWMSHGWITYGTTNLTIQQFAENYDGRVADRVLQMTYFKTFDFLGSDQTFRQLSETRKLTPQEIAENWKRFEKPKQAVEKIDLEKYFNELIGEPDSYFENKDNGFWTFVKSYLIRKKLLSAKDFDKTIDETFLDSSEMVLRRDVRETARMNYQHAPANNRLALIDRALSEITGSKIYDTAENLVARQKFMELRSAKHKFE